MDYTALIYIILIVLFMFLMRRSGIGCCGGHRPKNKDAEKDAGKQDDHKGRCG